MIHGVSLSRIVTCLGSVPSSSLCRACRQEWVGVLAASSVSLVCRSVGRSVCLSVAILCGAGCGFFPQSVAWKPDVGAAGGGLQALCTTIRSFAFIYPLSVSLLFVTTRNVPFGHFPDPFNNFDVLLLSGLEEHPETSNCMGCSKYIGEATTVRLTSPKRISVVCIL